MFIENDMTLKTQWQAGLSLFAVMVFTIVLYWPGLTGIFLVDDNVNLATLNHNGGITSWESARYFIFSNTSGSLGRPISMASFLLNDQYYPGDITSFRYTNIMIHCMVGLMAALLLVRLLPLVGLSNASHLWVVVAIVSWWYFSPINVSTTLYVIQRMTQLASLFTLLGLYLFLCGRSCLLVNPKKGFALIAIGLFGCGTLAVLSKESGALIFVYASIIEIAILQRQRTPTPLTLKFILFIPLAAMSTYLLIELPNYLIGYEKRHFTMSERVLTELRILADYIYRITTSRINGMGLMHDDIQLSTSLLSPIKTLYALIFHVSVCIVAWNKRYKWPLFFLGVFWFYGGHCLESSFIPLELYFEHRNYMPSFGIIIAVVSLLAVYSVKKNITVPLLLLMIICAAFFCWQRSTLWGDPVRQMNTWVYENPRSLRAQTINARNLLRVGDYSNGLRQIEGVKSIWPEAVHIDFIKLNQVCLRNFSNDFDMGELETSIRNGKYYSQLDAVLEITYKLAIRQECPDLLGGNIHEITRHLYNLQGITRQTKASIAFWKHEFYVERRDLNGAMAALEESFLFYPDSIPLYIQAKLMVEAGLYVQSYEFIGMAINNELAKPILKRKNIRAYQKFKSAVEAELIKSSS